MSVDQPNQQVLAVALVIESSLTIAQEWPRPLFEHCTHLIKRLGEAHPNAKLRLGFVGYGTADTVPSPVTCKQFFLDSHLLAKQIAEDYANLGIGMTNSGGSRGMAALEGVVAALELFETVTTLPNAKHHTCHIVHIAAASADNSQHPSYNQNIALDDLNWETLPSEFKQRNVSYSILAPRPLQGRLLELYAALNSGAGASTPWFPMKSPYTLYAAPFVAMQPVKPPTPAKRANEPPVAADRSPESKRPRLQPANNNTDSPKATPKAAAVQPSPRPPSQPQPPPPQQLPQPPPIQQQPPPQPNISPAPLQVPPIQAQPPAAPPIMNFSVGYQQVLQRLTNANEHLKRLQASAIAAENDGNRELAEAIKREYASKKEPHEKMVNAFRAHFQKFQAANQQGQGSQQPKDPNMPFTLGAPPPSNGHMPGGSGPPQLDIMSAAHMQHARTLSAAGGFPPPNSNNTPTMNPANIPVPTGGPPNITVQMQKMIEQQRRAGMPVGNNMLGGGGGGMQNQNLNIGGGGNLPPQFGPGPGMGMGGQSDFLGGMGGGDGMPQAGPSHMPPQPQQQQQQPLPPGHVAIWSGPLNWTGTGAQGVKKDVQALVIASTANPGAAQPMTWPVEMHITPAREQFGLRELEMWIKKHGAAVCLFKPQQGVPEAAANEHSYTALYTLLLQKSMYATAAWTTPMGGQTRNALFFPHPSAGCLAAAVFPLTGVPEFPKPVPEFAQPPVTLPGTNIPPNIPPQLVARLHSMTPEQRQGFFQQMRARQQLSQQGQQPQQPNQGQAHPQNMANMNMNAVLNMMNPTGQIGQGGAPMMGMNPQGSLGRPAGGNPVSYEMLQSFMQRNATDNNMGQKS